MDKTTIEPIVKIVQEYCIDNTTKVLC